MQLWDLRPALQQANRCLDWQERNQCVKHAEAEAARTEHDMLSEQALQLTLQDSDT